MNRRLIIIIVAAIVLIAALVTTFVLIGGRSTAKEDPELEARNNMLRLAREYYDHSEYQRALDLIDTLLIQNVDDEDARTLRNEIIRAKQDADETAKLEEAQQAEDLKDSISESIKESQPQVVINTPAVEDPEETQRKAEEDDRRREEEARRREEDRRQEEERLLAAQELKKEELEARRKANALIEEGIAALEAEDYEGAREKFSEALDLHENSAQALAYMGESYFQEDSGNQRNLQKAVEYSNKAIEKDGNYWLPHYTLGKIYESTKSWDNAIEEFSEAAKLNPERDDILYDLGKVQYRARRYADARQSFEACIHLNPRHDRAHFNLGVTHQRLGNQSKALESFQLAYGARPDFHRQVCRRRDRSATNPPRRLFSLLSAW